MYNGEQSTLQMLTFRGGGKITGSRKYAVPNFQKGMGFKNYRVFTFPWCIGFDISSTQHSGCFGIAQMCLQKMIPKDIWT